MLVTLLIYLLVFGLIAWLIHYLPIPQPWKTAAIVVLVVIAIVWLLGLVGPTDLAWPDR